MLVPSEALWSPRLQEYADFVAARDATEERRRDVTFLLSNRPARDLFIQRWRTWVFHFRRCLKEPGWFHRDPERLDEAVVELRSYARFVDRAAWPALYEVLVEIDQMAHQTRRLRQQLHASRGQPIASA
mgnify:CR=1 FL=1